MSPFSLHPALPRAENSHYAAPTVSTKPLRGQDEPPYARYAFLNPYNLSLLAGAGVAAAATGHWWMAVCGVAGEAMWMLFAPDSKLLQRTWFDKVWSEKRAAELADAQDAKLKQLEPMDQQRVLYLREQKLRIHQLAKENPSLTVELMGEELAKLDGLLDDFTDLALECNRGERHLATIDLRSMENSWHLYRGQVEKMPEGDKRRAVAKKNMQVLEQRRNRWDDLKKSAQTARGQMDLMENTFKLLGDEIVTMSSPEDLGVRLEDLRVGVEAIREATVDEGDVYEDLEEQQQQQQEEQRRR
jgi:hypothetical protein